MRSVLSVALRTPKLFRTRKIQQQQKKQQQQNQVKATSRNLERAVLSVCSVNHPLISFSPFSRHSSYVPPRTQVLFKLVDEKDNVARHGNKLQGLDLCGFVMFALALK